MIRYRMIWSSVVLLAGLLVSGCGEPDGPSLLRETDATPPSSPPCTTCRIFVTAATTTANFGGHVSAADAQCMADANKPVTGTFKALLWHDTERTTTTDWPLKPNTQYFRTDGVTPITSTDALSQLTFNFTNAIGGGNVWSGINIFTSPWEGLPGSNCFNWSNNTLASIGLGGATDQTALGFDVFTCQVDTAQLYCVEQ